MTSCAECRMLVENNCASFQQAEKILGRSMPPPPIGGCEIPIVEDYLRLIQSGMQVLDVGCGSWSLIKDYCEKVGAHYEGIDTESEYFGRKSVATRFENLAELSFPDEMFDLVIGNQTMEHWAEYGCTTQWGLYQCFRVCKPGGKVLLNVPIHFHGTSLFLMGRLDQIKELFSPFSNTVTLYSWGEHSAPIPKYFPHPDYWALRNKPAYNLDIHAVKDKPLPLGYSNTGALSGWIARIAAVPFSYLLYRLLKLIRLAK